MLRDRRAITRKRRAAMPALVTGLMLVGGAASCGSGDEGDSGPVGAAGYTAVIDGFLPTVPDDGSRPVVYVARLGDEPFALGDQVTMIDAVADTHDLRFVDDIEAAVDAEDSDAPPRDDGLLLGIGTISVTTPHVVRVEVYAALGRVDAQKLTLNVRDGVWRVDASEQIDPEVLVGDE